MKKLHWIKGNHLELAFPLTIVNFSESGKTSSNYDVSSDGFSVEVILQGMCSRKKFKPEVRDNVLRIVDEGTLDVDTYSVEIVVKEPNGTDVDTLRRSKWNHVLQVHDSNEKVVEQFDDFPDYAEGAIIEGSVFFFVGSDIAAETDPIFSASPAATITDEKIAEWNDKQDAISDLDTIREDAALGATAVQKMKFVEISNNLAEYLEAKDNEYYNLRYPISELNIYLPDTYSEAHGEKFFIRTYFGDKPIVRFTPGGGYGGHVYAEDGTTIQPNKTHEFCVRRVSNYDWLMSVSLINTNVINTITPSGNPQTISEDEDILDTTE